VLTQRRRSAGRSCAPRHGHHLRDATLISGGNDETDGNVQLVRRRDGWSVDGHLTEIHPEIGEAVQADNTEPGEPGCQVLAVERPQLLVTNLMVASAMLNALWAVIEHGSVPYSEVYLDVITGVARPQRWIRLEAGMRSKGSGGHVVLERPAVLERASPASIVPKAIQLGRPMNPP
jgi:hypothetical protein